MDSIYITYIYVRIIVSALKHCMFIYLFRSACSVTIGRVRVAEMFLSHFCFKSFYYNDGLCLHRNFSWSACGIATM